MNARVEKWVVFLTRNFSAPKICVAYSWVTGGLLLAYSTKGLGAKNGKVTQVPRTKREEEKYHQQPKPCQNNQLPLNARISFL